MKKYAIYWLVLAIVCVTGCQKEQSFELGGAPGEGAIQSDITGDCLPKTVNGIYEAGKVLVPNTNTITVDINVTKTGTWSITTDTINGYFFKGTGRFTTLGVNTVTLQSQGTPFADGINNFVVSYLGETCDIQVDVLPAGAGGPAEFTIASAGTPANCSGATAAGTYIIGSDLNGTNTVTITANVTKIGTYTITSTLTNGMTFTKTGAFLSTGTAIPVTLVGSGKPTGTAGAITIPLTAGAPTASTCSFVVNTVAGADFAINCAGATVNGTYQIGTALSGATNTVVLPITVTSAGPYSITTTINGMTFTGSGSVVLTPVPTTSITLTGSGTPTGTAGTVSVPVTYGASTCSFDVPVIAGTVTIDWEFTVGGLLRKGTSQEAILDNSSGFAQLIIQGDEDNGIGSFGLPLSNMTGAISTGVYSGTVITGKFATFVYTDGTLAWIAGPTLGSNLPVNLTVFNTTTKTVEGTFSGTVMDNSNVSVPLTGGKFKAKLP